MRDYAKISGTFWTGKTGKALRGDMQAQIVALYLMSSPHSEMTGVFNCPILYIAHETGLSIEGASEGLASLIEAGFCTFDHETDTVFVHEMARYQIGDELKPTDNRIIGVQKIYAKMPESLIRRGFYAKYKELFFLPEEGKKGVVDVSPLQAPSKPETETETENKPKRASGKPEVSEGFATFWNTWPSSDRKTARMECFKRWKARGLESSAAEIVGHVESLKDSQKWVKGFGPAPLTYLNQQHWLDGENEGSKPVWEQ